MTTCNKCLIDYEDDDILWATPTGELSGDTRPYCVACAPEEPNYGSDCLCSLCGCGAEAQYGHLCAYCDSAHPEYHKHDCNECEGE